MTNTTEFKVGDSFIVTKESIRKMGYTHVYVVTEVFPSYVHFINHDGLDCIAFMNEIEKNNSPQRHPHADLIIQWTNDQSLKIQFRENSAMEWRDVDSMHSPCWYHDYQYRVKPKTKVVEKDKYAYLDPQTKRDVISDWFTDEEWAKKVRLEKIEKFHPLYWTTKEFEVEI